MKKQNAHWVLLLFFFVSAIVGVAFFQFAGKRGTMSSLQGNLKGYFQTHSSDRSKIQPKIAGFGTLHEAARQKDLSQFKAMKKDLRTEISEALKTVRDSKEYDRAENIALYLFPELLSDDDLEKDVALSEWSPLQKNIEKNPKSDASQKNFEEFKNSIWNYENPDRQNPAISEYAEQVIRIYEALSQLE